MDNAQFKLRLPIDLKASIEASAWSNRRTINAEIVSQLEASGGKTLRDEFAMAAPSPPEWFEFADEPKYTPAGRDRYNQPVYEETLALAYKAAHQAWTLRRDVTWRYLYADAMLSERQKGGAE